MAFGSTNKSVRAGHDKGRTAAAPIVFERRFDAVPNAANNGARAMSDHAEWLLYVWFVIMAIVAIWCR